MNGLNKLQEKIVRKTGKELSEQEVLKKVLDFVNQNEGFFFQTQFLEWRNPSDEEWKVMSSIISDFSKENLKNHQ